MSLGLLRSWLNQPATPKRRHRLASKRPVAVEQLEERQLLSASPGTTTLLSEPLMLDFGTSSSPVAPGATQASLATYSAARGFGWKNTLGLSAIDRGTNDPLTRDFHRGRDNTFLVKLPDGGYQITAILGDSLNPMNRVNIVAGGQTVASGLSARAGGTTIATFKAQVTDDQLKLRFVDKGGTNPYFALAALNIEPIQSVNAGPDQKTSEGQAVTFAGQVSSSANLTYLWDFGDGSQASGTLEPTHAYQDNGVYTVTLMVSDGESSSVQDTLTVTVENAAPEVYVGEPPAGQAGAPIIFGPLYVHDSGPADQQAGFNYWWDFGDGAISTDEAPTHVYTDPGTYTVTVWVQDKDGDWGVSQTTALVGEQPGDPPPDDPPPGDPPSELSADAGADQHVSEGQAINFGGSATGSGGLTYLWDFGDGNQAGGTLNPSHAYQDNGTYTVTLTVSDGGSASVWDTLTVTVTNAAPSANLGGPFARQTGSPIQFGPSVTDASPIDADAGFLYSWDFGDGATSSESAPSHAYGAPGTYTVTLTVTDKDEGASTVTTTVTVTQPVQAPPPGDVISTAAGLIPNFGANPTITSARSGNWSDAATWSLGRLPTTGDIVAVTSGRTVTYDLSSDSALKTVVIQSGGHLVFRTDINTRLTVSNLLVLEGGELRIGTASNPVAAGVKAEVVIPDLPLDLVNDPDQFGNGLIGLGKVTLHGSVKSDTFLRLAVEPQAGDTTLRLAQPVTGWRAGDRLVLPDSRQLGAYEDPRQWEVLTLTGVSADGRTLSLSAPIQFRHPGGRDLNGALHFMPHVGNLSRNVVIRSANAGSVWQTDPAGVAYATTTRGHTLFTGQADVDIRYAQFTGLGRTTNQQFNDTTYDANGNITHVGINQSGRYSVHFRDLAGPGVPQANGYRYTFVGNSIFCPVDDHYFRWGLTISNSHHGLIQGNVLYNWAGWGIGTELGFETGNVIERNFVVRVRGTGVRFDQVGGFGFYFDGPDNYVRDNVAANITSDFGGWLLGFGIFSPNDVLSVREFARNEAYAMRVGLVVYDIGAIGDFASGRVAGDSIIQDFASWHVADMAYFQYPADRVILVNFKALNENGSGKGIIYGDYPASNVRIVNAHLEGFSDGISVPSITLTPLQIEGGYLRNRANVTGSGMFSTNGSAGIPPRTIIIRGTRFEAFPGEALNAITRWTGINPSDAKTNYIQLDQWFVYDYNGQAGVNFQIYDYNQAPDKIVPADDPGASLTGAPEPGLTNQESWDKYRIAFAGEIAPPDAVEGWDIGIGGLVRRI